MAAEIVVIEGFDYYPSDVNTPGVGLLSSWIKQGPVNVQAGLVTGRFEGRAMSFYAEGGSGNIRYPFKKSNQVALGFAFKGNVDFGNLRPGIGTRFFYLFDEFGDPQVEFYLDRVGYITVCRANLLDSNAPTILARAKRRMFKNTWHYIEFGCTIADGGTIQLFIDGEDQFDGPLSRDTQASNTANAGQIGFFTESTYGVVQHTDDLYVIIGSTEVLGENRIQLLEPEADADVDWTPLTGSDNFEMVNETSSDGDTSYNSSNTPGDRDLFDLTDIVVNPTIIHAVGLTVACRKEDSATRTIRGAIRSNGAEAWGVNYNLTNQYLWDRSIFEKDPDGNIAWTKLKVNALEAGYQLVL